MFLKSVNSVAHTGFFSEGVIRKTYQITRTQIIQFVINKNKTLILINIIFSEEQTEGRYTSTTIIFDIVIYLMLDKLHFVSYLYNQISILFPKYLYN